MRVLLAADGFPPSRAAMQLLEAVGRRDLKVTTLSVAILGSSTPDWPPRYLRAAVTEDRDRIKAIAAESAERLSLAGFRVDARVADGHPGERISQLAADGGYDLTVLGCRHHRWAGSRFLGSTSNYVMHDAPGSVLLVHDPPAEPDRARVLIATDGSSWSEQAVAALVGLADPARCDVAVLSVAPALPWPAGAVGEAEVLHLPALIPSSPEAFAEAEHLAAERAHQAVDAALATLRAHGFSATSSVVAGSARTVILDAAQAGADLVVMGSRGLGPVRRAVMGSVSEPVSRHCAAALIGRPHSRVTLES